MRAVTIVAIPVIALTRISNYLQNRRRDITIAHLTLQKQIKVFILKYWSTPWSCPFHCTEGCNGINRHCLPVYRIFKTLVVCLDNCTSALVSSSVLLAQINEASLRHRPLDENNCSRSPTTGKRAVSAEKKLVLNPQHIHTCCSKAECLQRLWENSVFFIILILYH